MKKVFLLMALGAIVLSSCSERTGELIGSQGRPRWYGYDPYGMNYIQSGNFEMGQSDQDVPFVHQTRTKVVQLNAFYIDITEISNNEYRQFVEWVRDSLARRYLAQNEFEEEFLLEMYDDALEPIEDPDIQPLNWDSKLRWDDEEYFPLLVEQLVIPEAQRYYRRRQIDPRKLIFEYYWIDLKEAAYKGRPEMEGRPSNLEVLDGSAEGFTKDGGTDWRKSMKDGEFPFPIDQYDEDEEIQRGKDLDLGWRNKIGQNNAIRGHTDRSRFIIRERINVFPDTLVWVHDFTYSYHEPLTRKYFWHPAFDDYPVVGVTWQQAKAFCVWRTQLLNNFRDEIGEVYVDDYRLPTEAEWEYASRGGLKLSPYPWGGPYIRNSKGCFLGNFKPMRGRYDDDGGVQTVKVTSYHPNDYGLYCMAGNVAEWTSTAFDESMYEFSHDMNPEYQYNALDHDPISMKRKVIRGGSWKDIGYYLQTGTRTYEYQDTAKSYIGFRCVMSFLGRGGENREEGL